MLPSLFLIFMRFKTVLLFARLFFKDNICKLHNWQSEKCICELYQLSKIAENSEFLKLYFHCHENEQEIYQNSGVMSEFEIKKMQKM